MKLTTIKPILTLLVFLIFVTVSKAQEKYDLMNITYDTQRGGIYFSINGTQFTKEEVDLPKTSNTAVNTNPLLKRVNEFQEKNIVLKTGLL